MSLQSLDRSESRSLVTGIEIETHSKEETMGNVIATFETEDAFIAAELSDVHTLRDGAGDVWLVFGGFDGDWWAIRARNEDDPAGPDEDHSRPVGPSSIGNLKFPVAVIDVHDALAEAEAIATFETNSDERDRDWWIKNANVNNAEDCEACGVEEDLCPVHHGIAVGVDMVTKKLAALAGDPELFARVPDLKEPEADYV